MKKFLRILAVTLVALLCTTGIASAAEPYINITFDAQTKVEDHSPDPDWQVIGWYDTFGVGNTQIGDAMVLPDVDFGSNGPATVTVIAGNHADQPVKQLGVYIDAIDGTKIATLKVPNYKDWSDKQTITADIKAKVTGVHTVYVVWETKDAGSTWGISFTEKSAAAETSDAAAASNPKTGDSSLVLTIALLVVSLLAMGVLYKTRFAGAYNK